MKALGIAVALPSRGAGARRITYAVLLSMLLASGTATAAPLATLLVTSTNPILEAPMYVGVARDIFAKYGLTVRLEPILPGVGVLQRVVDGTAQAGIAAPHQVALALARGANLKGIFTVYGDATGRGYTDAFFVVIARKASGIRESHLEDLRGRKIGLPATTIAHEYLFYALAAKGLDSTNDVTIVSTPPAGLPGALQTGSVDAIVAPEVAASIAIGSTPDAIVVQRGGNYMQALGLEVVSARYLATHPGIMTRYTMAFAEAAQYVRSHRAETADLLMRNITGVTPAVVRGAIDIVSPDMRVSKVTVHGAQQSYDFAIKIKLLKQAPAFEEVFDLRILRQVEREHRELFRDLPPIPDALKL